MTETALPPARYGVAGAFLEALAAQDFAGLTTTLADSARMQALVPKGLREWDSSSAICAAFTIWFGDADGFELTEAVIGDVGVRLYLRWRVRMSARRLGAGWFVVEQHAYADTDPGGLISDIRLLCSGYCPEQNGT